MRQIGRDRKLATIVTFNSICFACRSSCACWNFLSCSPRCLRSLSSACLWTAIAVSRLAANLWTHIHTWWTSMNYCTILSMSYTTACASGRWYLVFFSASISSLTQRFISSCAVHCRSACLTPASLSSSSFSTSWDDRRATRCSPCSDCRSTSSTCLRSTSVQSPCSSFPVDSSFKACKAYESKYANRYPTKATPTSITGGYQHVGLPDIGPSWITYHSQGMPTAPPHC